MSNFEFTEECIEKAKKEFELHKKAKNEHPYWYSGHKNKTIRALQMAQEALQEIKKELQTTS